MITYQPFTAYSLKVLLDGKVVGHINEVFDTEEVAGQRKQLRRYQYFPKGRKEGGTKFPTMGMCKADIEGGNEA